MSVNKKETILITGSDGFIGKNLKIRFKENNHKVLTFNKSNNESELIDLISQSTVIFHLAGMNKSDKNLFDEVNFGLTKRICDHIVKLQKIQKKNIPIHFSSSTQALLDNPYGQSKLKAEDYIKSLSNKFDLKAYIYRLPGIFGKGCKPNYNSVVATFCHNISRNLPIKIDDPDKAIELVYIDELLDIFTKNLSVIPENFCYEQLQPIYKVKLNDLSQHITFFNKEKLNVDAVGNGFKRALYATFLSYLPKERFTYNLEKITDNRGEFLEFIKTNKSGQISFFTINKGFTRGNHYHHTKNEKFLVIKGQVKFEMSNIFSNERLSIDIKSGDNKVVESIPGWSHSIKNTGNETVIVILWSNEIFDKKNPDTFNEITI